MWKSRFLFLFAALCSILMVRFYDNKNIAFLAVYALVVMVVASLAAVFTAPLFLKLEEQADKMEVFKNDSLEYGAKLVNKGIFFYPRVECDYHNDSLVQYGGQVSALTPRGSIQNRDQVSFPYRGVYRIGVSDITVTDFLGLFQISFPVNNPVSVTVLPQSDEDFLLQMRNDSQNTAFRRDLYNESYTDIADVRKYDPSDSLRKIHWKLSAKRGELMVKNFHTFEPNETLIFVDLVESTLPEEERAAFEDRIVSYAAAAVDHCMLGRLSATLVYGGEEDRQVTVDYSEEPGRYYRILAEMAFDRDESAIPQFLQTMDRGNTSYNLLLFVWKPDRALVEAVESFATYDDRIYVYCFCSENLPLTREDKSCLESLRALGVNATTIEG